MSWSTHPSPRAHNPTPTHLIHHVRHRDGYRCVLCSAPGKEVDHIDRHGPHDPENLQTLCTACHHRKTQTEAQTALGERNARGQRPRRRTPHDDWANKNA